MGNNICGVVINLLPNLTDSDSLDKKKLKTKFTKTKIKGLSPKDLSISFLGKNTLIFLDLLFYKNLSEVPELTNLEIDLNTIFPNSRILIFAINDTVDFAGYSLIDNGIKLRTKATINDGIFLDYGELNEKETELYNEIFEFATSYPEVASLVDEKTLNNTPIEKKKFYLSFRDRMYRRRKLENEFNYDSGSLDNYIIETEFQKLLNCTYYDIESLDFIEFERRKLNFSKDSLKEFLYVAKRELG